MDQEPQQGSKPQLMASSLLLEARHREAGIAQRERGRLLPRTLGSLLSQSLSFLLCNFPPQKVYTYRIGKLFTILGFWVRGVSFFFDRSFERDDGIEGSYTTCVLATCTVWSGRYPVYTVQILSVSAVSCHTVLEVELLCVTDPFPVPGIRDREPFRKSH